MNSNTYYTSLCLAVGIAIAVTAEAQTPPAQIPRASRPPILEDYVAGAPRTGELILDDFRQREPNDGDAATEATRAYLSHDAQYLYVAFVCLDRDPARIRARLSKRDAIAQDDQAIVMLDTFHDRQRSYLFAVNPLGIQADAIASEGRDDDYSFDTVWRSTGRLIPGGFAVLLTIPFKSLRISSDPNALWGVALSRLIPRNSEQSFWPYVTRRVEGLAQQFATMESPRDISRGRHVQLLPYAAASAGRYLDAGTGSYVTPVERRTGLDAKIVVRDAVAVDLAVNPDFSQVESDQPQVAVNQRFELFYPEKRPFFLENASMFKYSAVPATRNIPELLFFSRRIQDLDVGTRVTGKAGRWSFGALAADDRGPASPDGRQRAAIAVGRVQRELGKQSTVGLFVTSRDKDGVTNRVGAVDLRWKLSSTWVLTGQAVTSRSALQDGSRPAGSAYNASLLHSSRKLLYSLFYSDRSPSFHAALGFVPRTDIRQIEQYTEHRWRPRTGPVTAIGPNSYFRFNWNRNGDLQEWIVRFPFQVNLKGRTELFVRRVEACELFNGIDLREHFQTINLTTEWLKWLAISEGLEWGSTPNYFPPAGIAPYVGHSVNASLGLTFRPTPRVRYEQTVIYSELRDVFANTITRSILNYQFTRALSVRAIIDYNAVIPNAALARVANDKRVGVDTLFTYQLGPGTAFYAGYTSGFQNVEASSAGPVERIRAPTTQVGRQLFMKVSYLIRR